MHQLLDFGDANPLIQTKLKNELGKQLKQLSLLASVLPADQKQTVEYYACLADEQLPGDSSIKRPSRLIFFSPSFMATARNALAAAEERLAQAQPPANDVRGAEDKTGLFMEPLVATAYEYFKTHTGRDLDRNRVKLALEMLWMERARKAPHNPVFKIHITVPKAMLAEPRAFSQGMRIVFADIATTGQ